MKVAHGNVTCLTTLSQEGQQKNSLRGAGSEDQVRWLQTVKYLSDVNNQTSH